MPSNSYIQIDNFQIFDLFNFIMGQPLESATETRGYTGTLHVISRFFVDQFKINFPKLTQDQMNQLNVLVQKTGVDALHTVIYSSDNNLIRKWDSSTTWSAGYGINDDVQRLRRKVRIRPVAIPHWDRLAGFYSATLDCIEG